MDADERLTRIYSLLYALGARANLCGFRYLSYAIFLCMENPERLARPSQRLYPEIASQYRTDAEEASRQMRRVIYAIWKENPQRMEQLAGKPLRTYPPPKQFLKLACQYLERKS